MNLAYDFDANRDLIAAMNAKLNALIAAEIGVDDGSFLPLKDWIDWDKAGAGQRQSVRCSASARSQIATALAPPSCMPIARSPR